MLRSLVAALAGAAWFLINRLLRLLLFMPVRGSMDLLRSRLTSSALCQPYSWVSDVDEATSLYDGVISRILDETLPIRLIVRRPRPSDPWFDADCRTAKRLTRRLSGLFWRPLVVLPLQLAVPPLLRRLPLLIRLESCGMTRDVLTVNFVTGSVLILVR